METLNPDFKGAVCSSLDEVVYLNQKNFGDFSFHISSEYLKTSPVVFYFPKKSILVEAFDEKMSFLKAAGLIDYWIAKHMDLKYINVKEESTGPRVMKLHTLLGIFTIWFIGCMIGLICFAFEILRRRKMENSDSEIYFLN